MKKTQYDGAGGEGGGGSESGELAFVEAHTQEIDKWRQSIRAQAQAQQTPQAQ